MFGLRRREHAESEAAAEAVHPRRVRGMTAAATQIDLSDQATALREASKHRKRPLQWQKDAWLYHDELDPVRNYARWQGDAQSLMRLYPAYYVEPDQPAVPAQEVDGLNPREVQAAIDALSRIRNPDDDLSELQRVCGVNIAMTGEVWFVGTDNPEFVSDDNPTGESYRVCSVEELVVHRDGRWAIAEDENSRDTDLEFLDPESTVLVRAYRRHGRRRHWPDSPMRSANLICRELLIATQGILASLEARLSAGILPIPNDLEVEGGKDDDDEETDESPVLTLLKKHLMAPKTDPRSPASIVPYLLEVPPDVIGKLALVDIARTIDPQLLPRMEALLRRFAIAVDMPPEQLLGIADMNHWNVFEMQEDGVRMHIEPVTSIYAGAMTTKIWRPKLAMMGVAEPDRWTLRWDPQAVAGHPDRTDTMLKGYEANPPVVSSTAVAKALGIAEDEMPDEQELADVLDFRQRVHARFQETGPLGEEVGMKPNAPADAGPTAGPPPGADGGVQASAAPPPRRGRTLGDEFARIEGRLQRDLLVEADAVLRRMVERASAKVRTAAGRNPETRSLASDLPAEWLAAVLGPQRVNAELGLSDDDLFGAVAPGIGTRFAAWTARARRDARTALRRAGAPLTDEEWAAYEQRSQAHVDEGAALLVTALMGIGASLLYAGAATPQHAVLGELDSTLRAGPGDVKAALTMAGGGAADGARGSGFLGGADWVGVLMEAANVDLGGWVWAVGAPERPFQPHQDLDGVQFSSWEDDALAWSPDEFPYVSFLSPEDHSGCQCTAVPDATVTVGAE